MVSSTPRPVVRKSGIICAGAVGVHVAGSDIGALHNLCSVVARHIQDFATTPPDIHWSGDGSQLKSPPDFRVLRVLGHYDLTPRMRRIRFAAENPEGFAVLKNSHVRLVFSPSGAMLVLPTLGANRMEHWPQGEATPYLGFVEGGDAPPDGIAMCHCGEC